ncbi:hypothetical protein BpHYR1_032605 [Brachionus plicatilis]|uniref:Uncharacterized protein n=1 Tax=Brachionus plicatilis TaxID=10195 RepID=A0A3M7QZE1_BRAPC|nr:hypothetical protein BpHYR1_032605 [Brachionus plicatilis]
MLLRWKLMEVNVEPDIKNSELETKRKRVLCLLFKEGTIIKINKISKIQLGIISINSFEIVAWKLFIKINKSRFQHLDSILTHAAIFPLRYKLKYVTLPILWLKFEIK